MNKPETILTDAEMHILISGNPFTLGLSIARLKDFIRQVEKAVVAKLAEQEPIGYLHANSISFLSAKGVTAEQARSDDYNMPLYTHPIPAIEQEPVIYLYAGDLYAADDMGINDHIREHGTPLYTHPIPSKQGILDSSKTITKENLPPLPEPHCRHWGGIGYFDSYSKEQMIEYAKSAIDHHRTTKSHIAADEDADRSNVSAESQAKIMAAAQWLADNIIMAALGTATKKDIERAYRALELRTASELMITHENAKETPDGWKLVPEEPTMEMYDAWLGGKDNDAHYWNDVYKAMLAAAPKYVE